MEREILERAKQKLGLEKVELLHPSVMYKLLRFFWYREGECAAADRAHATTGA